jgi:hypothetical protein
LVAGSRPVAGLSSKSCLPSGISVVSFSYFLL